MQRTLKVERVYNLGDYKSIRFSDEIVDVEDGLNQEVIELLAHYQLLSIEKRFHDYRQLLEDNADVEDKPKQLAQAQTETLNKILDLLKE